MADVAEDDDDDGAEEILADAPPPAAAPAKPAPAAPAPRRARPPAPAARAGTARAGAGRAGAARPRPLGVWKCLWREGHARNAHDDRRARRARRPATPAAAVDKAAYSAWEAEVIAAFFTRSHERTPLMPTDGAPVHLRKEKYILVADAASDPGRLRRVVRPPRADLRPAVPPGQTRGRRRALRVREEEGIFKHPAIDVGGLTNLRQKLGERVDFEGPSTSWGPGASDDVEDVARALASQWNELAMEAFEPPKASDRDVAPLGGARDGRRDAALLPLTARAPRRRHLERRQGATGGKYYLRTYDNSGGAYAKASDGKGLYCGVTDGFITPNLRESNIVMEYVSENSVRSPPPKKQPPAAEGGLFGRMCRCFSAAS